jgi:hypothetical protein
VPKARLLARRNVAALCVSGRSIYRYMDRIIAFGEKEDARTFKGGMPVVAHPPCRHWSHFLARQAKAPDPEAEMQLGTFCVRMVRQHGGVLEHPAKSHLFDATGMPVPNAAPDKYGGWTLYVEQRWFGYMARKATWLYIVGVPKRSIPPIPFFWDSIINGRKHWQGSKSARSRTMLPFARFLCQIARLSQV